MTRESRLSILFLSEVEYLKLPQWPVCRLLEKRRTRVKKSSGKLRYRSSTREADLDVNNLETDDQAQMKYGSGSVFLTLYSREMTAYREIIWLGG